MRHAKIAQCIYLSACNTSLRDFDSLQTIIGLSENLNSGYNLEDSNE